jgi:RNA polymerase sigma-70 factor (ECF subfamily)
MAGDRAGPLDSDRDGPSDEDLFRVCRESADGEAIRRAVAALAGRHERGLTRYLTNFVGSRETAEDLAQEAFIRIYQHAREYREVARVSTWLYRIATNLALNEIRDRKHRPRFSLDARAAGEGGEGEALLEGLAERREPRPEERAQARDLAARVRAAVAELPEVYRAVILLCDLEGFSYEQAAAALDVKIGTIRSRLFRAREQVQEKLGPLVVRGEI